MLATHTFPIFNWWLFHLCVCLCFFFLLSHRFTAGLAFFSARQRDMYSNLKNNGRALSTHTTSLWMKHNQKWDNWKKLLMTQIKMGLNNLYWDGENDVECNFCYVVLLLLSSNGNGNNFNFGMPWKLHRLFGCSQEPNDLRPFFPLRARINFTFSSNLLKPVFFKFNCNAINSKLSASKMSLLFDDFIQNVFFPLKVFFLDFFFTLN